MSVAGAVGLTILGLVMCAVCTELRRAVVRRRALGLVMPSNPRGRRVANGSEHPAVDELAVELVMVLVASALRSGVAIPRALAVVADQLPEGQAEPLTRVCTALQWGAGWSTATDHVEGPMASLLAALAPAWESGANPDAALRLWSEQLRRDRRSLARVAAERLAVHLVVPLGVCMLPAFVFLGLVPLVVSFGAFGG